MALRSPPTLPTLTLSLLFPAALQPQAETLSVLRSLRQAGKPLSMEFWGLEVKPGETVKCDPGEDRYVHMSQVTLGDTKKDKGNEIVPVFVKVKEQKLVLGTLSAEKCTQISYDIVFEKEFELSHGSKSASVYFLGYKTSDGDNINSDFSDSDSEEDIQLDQKANGKPEVTHEQSKPAVGKAAAEKPGASAAKSKVKVDESKKADKLKEDGDEDDEDSDDDDSEDVSDEDEDMAEPGDESDEDDEDEDESSDEEDEDTSKADTGKKRPAGSGSKTPAPEKKAKLVSPIGSQKTGADGKKSHIATPYPVKQIGKTSVNSDKSKQQAPKSSNTVSCKSCSRIFNSENALQAHTKAKHGTAK